MRHRLILGGDGAEGHAAVGRRIIAKNKRDLALVPIKLNLGFIM